MSNTIYKIKGRESLNDFIFMSLFFITKNNSFGTKIIYIYIYILIGKVQRKSNQILQLKSISNKWYRFQTRVFPRRYQILLGSLKKSHMPVLECKIHVFLTNYIIFFFVQKQLISFSSKKESTKVKHSEVMRTQGPKGSQVSL